MYIYSFKSEFIQFTEQISVYRSVTVRYMQTVNSSTEFVDVVVKGITLFTRCQPISLLKFTVYLLLMCRTTCNVLFDRVVYTLKYLL